MSKKTVGQLSQELLYKEESPDYTVVDIRREVEKDYVSKVDSTIEEGIRKYPRDFYVVVEAKRERLMKNVLRNLIFHAPVCPTPHYGQTVYKYIYKDSKIEFLWCIPDKSECLDMLHSPQEYIESDRESLQSVLDFYDGVFARRCLELNGENEKLVTL